MLTYTRHLLRPTRVRQLEEDCVVPPSGWQVGSLVRTCFRKTINAIYVTFSFSELMPILLNILIGVPQMLSSLQVPRFNST